MRYLVTLENVDPGPLLSPQQVIDCLELRHIPTLEACAKLEAQHVIVAGGALSGEKQAAIIVEADSLEEVQKLLEDLPKCGVMHTEITPLQSFEERVEHDREFLELFRATLH